jgi:hypothetical protein
MTPTFRPKREAARFPRRALRLGLLLAALLTTAAISPLVAQGVTTWQTGDVFAGVGNGQYKVYDNAGNFKETIQQTATGFTTGCSFNNSESHLYTTNFSTNQIFRFQAAAPLHAQDQVTPTPGVTPPPEASNESISFMASGNYLVGHADGGRDVHQYTEAGLLVAEYDVATEDRGSDWIDLAANQTTLFYTSEGMRVLRFDIGTNTQMADFATGLPGSAAYALRILPPGDGSGGVLVADTQTIVRLNGSGAVVQQYDAAGEDNWFALNLDPNGTSFWSGDLNTGNFYRFNIASGAVEVGPIASGGVPLAGLCLKGEPTAGGGDGQCPPEDDDDNGDDGNGRGDDDDDDDNDGLTNKNESLFLTLLGNSDSDLDGIKDGNDDANGNGEDDEDEDDDECPDDDDSDGDGTDDEDEDDDEDDD